MESLNISSFNQNTFGLYKQLNPTRTSVLIVIKAHNVKLKNVLGERSLINLTKEQQNPM